MYEKEIAEAKAAGYSDEEINQHLAGLKKSSFIEEEQKKAEAGFQENNKKQSTEIMGAQVPNSIAIPVGLGAAGIAAGAALRSARSKAPSMSRVEPSFESPSALKDTLLVDPPPIEDVPQAQQPTKAEPVNLKDKLAAIQQATGTPQATPAQVASEAIPEPAKPLSPAVDAKGELKVPDAFQPKPNPNVPTIEGVPLSAEERQIARLQAQREATVIAGREAQSAAVQEFAKQNPLSERNKNWLYSQAGNHTASVQKAANLGPNSTIQQTEAAVTAWKEGKLPGVAPTVTGKPSVPVGEHGAFGKAPPNFPQGQHGIGKLPVLGGVALGAGALAAAPYVIDSYKKGKLDPLLDATPVVGTLRKGGTPIDAILDIPDLATDFNPYTAIPKMAYHGYKALMDEADQAKQEREDAVKYGPLTGKKRYKDMSPTEQKMADDKFYGRPNYLNDLTDPAKNQLNQKLSQKDIKFISKYFR